MTNLHRIRNSMRWLAAGLAAVVFLSAAGSAEAASRKKKKVTSRVVMEDELGQPVARAITVRGSAEMRRGSGEPSSHAKRGAPLIQVNELYTLSDKGGRSDQ